VISCTRLHADVYRVGALDASGLALLRDALRPPPPDVPPTVATRRRTEVAVAAVLMIVVVLGLSGAGLLVQRHAAGVRAATAATGLSDSYEDASHTATVEQSLERAWRLGRDRTVLQLHAHAAETLTAALARVRAAGTRTDRALVSRGQVLHSEHLAAFTAETQRPTASGARSEASAEDLQDLLTRGAQASYATASRLRAQGNETPYVLLLLVMICLSAAGAVSSMALRQRRVRRDLRQLQEQTERLAMSDALTGLPNRVVLRDRLEQALLATRREGTCMALLVLDLDSFKEINDSLGHDYGDLLLTQLGPRLLGPLRASDTVARMGGDEFGVLLPRVADLNAALLVAEKLQESLIEPFDVHGLQLSVEASIGVVMAPDHGVDAGTLLQRADVAMYVAKDGGLGVSAYDQTLDGSSPTRAALLNELRRAVDENELFLVYQPKCSAATGALEGVEALVRWQHPERGLLLPDEFLPLAERTGLIHPLTRHVLAAALADCRSWLDRGVELPVAVNLSARTLLDRAFATEVEQMLTYWGVPGHLLEFEVTETALMADPERARALLESLGALGVILAIDDFGTGYSSLASLRTLPVDDVKIDRSFVTPMLTSPNDAFIVRSVIALAHDVGLRVVAEGVEDASTHAALAELGCDVVQGYHLGLPMSGIDLCAQLVAGRIVSTPARAGRTCELG
jgi:diguanylate cyclase (GGDEF)-like protein